MRADWENYADNGDGQYAIALAILQLAYQVKSLGNGDAATPMGAIEALGKSIKESAEIIAASIGQR